MQRYPQQSCALASTQGRLAVNNGRSGNREPLFLGDAANHAAKLASNLSTKGIYLTNAARLAIGLKEVDAPAKTALTKDETKECQDAADLDVTAATLSLIHI